VRRLATVAGLAALLATVLAGCGGSDDDPAPRLSASTTQFRQNEGTQVLRTGVVNEGSKPVVIESAALHWPGFDGPEAHVGKVLGHGEIAAFDLTYGAAHCDHQPSPKAQLDVVANNHQETIPVEVQYAGLLVDLWKRACATQRLDRAATVTLERGHLAKDGYRTSILLARQTDPAPVKLVDVLGSVNLVLEARTPVALHGRQTRVPLLIHPTLRCDAHSLSQTSQEYLFSAWATVAGSAPVRVFLRVTPAIQAGLDRMIDRDCLS
jgi:hypothetical protein